jgi:hypothetical protein
MSSSNLIRLGGLATMVGGVLFLARPFIDLAGFLFVYNSKAGSALLTVAVVVALLLVPVGMVGFHTLQRHSYGRIGRTGFWLADAGALMMVVGGAVFFTLGEAGDFLQASPPLVWVGLGALGLVGGFASMVVGFWLYGVASLHARVLPRWCGVAFIAALPVALASGILFPLWLSEKIRLVYFPPWDLMFMVFGLVWLALGYALWRRREAPTVQQSRRVR